ncbi:MAG: polar growth protein [Vezdaea acicularis]|nr:MAG: polar growth protein [Vezdaea acicularis]
MVDCDYSGWMKKKSNRIMTLWKPRLFVLRGRRLSYYYSEDDTEEQGLIDISYHRVLPADSDRITGLHATLTRATASPSSPENPTTPTLASQEAMAELKTGAAGNKNTDQGGMYIFKLEPPRSGIGTNFTRPEVHYFAVDNITQGRAWMAALVKATIDIDTKMPMTTTYNQPTISLARARQLKHRPPALRDLDENEDHGTGETESISGAGGGLGIDFEGSTDVEASEVKSTYTETEAGHPRVGESVTEVETEKSSERA